MVGSCGHVMVGQVVDQWSGRWSGDGCVMVTNGQVDGHVMVTNGRAMVTNGRPMVG